MISLEELTLTPEFLVLSQKQKLFVTAFLLLNDASRAAQVAYKSPNSAILGAALLKQKKIKRVLDVHFGRSKMDSLLEDLHRVIKHSLRRGSKKGVTPELAAALAFYEKHSAAKRTVNTVSAEGDGNGDGTL
jgi:hypothetical protein